MGCAASREDRKSGKDKKQKGGANAEKRKGRQASSASANDKGGAARKPATAKGGKKQNNPLAEPSKGKQAPVSSKTENDKFHPLFAAHDDKSSDLSSIVSDVNSSRVTDSHVATTVASVAPSASSPSNNTSRPSTAQKERKSTKRSSTATITAGNNAVTVGPDEPKWKKQVAIKRSNMTKSREGPEGLSANKLARVQKWIDFSDQGTSPLGPLLSPQDYQGQVERDERMQDYVKQGIPLYAQANSSDPVTESERKRSLAPERKKFLAIRVTARLKSKVANALLKVKRRHSKSFGPAGELEASGGGPQTSEDAANGTQNGGQDGDPSDDHETSDKHFTGSLANIDNQHEIMSHAVLDADSHLV